MAFKPSLPKPERGLVISYSFLWREEWLAGRREGRKDRPCAIVLVVDEQGGQQRVVVAPITHSAPVDPDVALELPTAVKRHLGLDDAPSWVVLDRLNRFVWPGCDLRRIPGHSGRFSYGLLPPAFYGRVTRQLAALWAARRVRSVARSDAD